MRAAFGQQIIVEARPGAGGNLAMEAAAKARRRLLDGLRRAYGGDQRRALQEARLRPAEGPGAALARRLGSYVVYASGSAAGEHRRRAHRFAKARPGKLNYASVGVGSDDLATVLFTLAAGFEMSHVPYKGIQQAAPELVSGDVHLTFNALVRWRNSSRAAGSR